MDICNDEGLLSPIESFYSNEGFDSTFLNVIFGKNVFLVETMDGLHEFRLPCAAVQ